MKLPELAIQKSYERPKTCMENKSSVNERPFLLQASSYQVWVQAIARSFYQAGHGSIHFFMPLIFVNKGLFSNRSWVAMVCRRLRAFSGGAVGLSHLWAQANVVILGWVVNSRGSCSSTDSNFTDAHPRDLIVGLSSGCYWTAADAVIDVTPSEHRQKRLHSWL